MALLIGEQSPVGNGGCGIIGLPGGLAWQTNFL